MEVSEQMASVCVCVCVCLNTCYVCVEVCLHVLDLDLNSSAEKQ